jgi:anti-sigma factor RsiW
MNDSVDRFRDWDAAYVLGALSADDRREFERHLSTCPECAADVAELAGLPGILSKLPSERAVALLSLPEDTSIDDSHLLEHQHTPGLVQRLAVASNRRRRRFRVAMFAAAAVVVALVTVGGIAIGAAQNTAPPIVAMAPLHQDAITASIQVTKKGWGTRFDWSCAYMNSAWAGTATSYDLVVTDKAGKTTTVATWTTAGPEASGLSASTGIPTANIRSVEIRLTGTTTPLLRENL